MNFPKPATIIMGALLLMACVPISSPPPPPDPGEIVREGICGRTPEVQTALMRMLAADGPRMSCREIQPDDLYRLRELTLDSPYLVWGDLHDLTSLWKLKVITEGSPIPAGIFEDLESLTELTIVISGPGDQALQPGTFRQLDNLEHLTLQGRRNRASFHLSAANLQGPTGLRTLRVDSVESVTPTALMGLPKLERVDLTAAYRQPRQRDTSAELPAELTQGLTALEKFRARHFRD